MTLFTLSAIFWIRMDESKFTVSYGKAKGSKQVTFYFVSRVTKSELLEMMGREFPNIPDAELLILPGPGFCTVTTGLNFEV